MSYRCAIFDLDGVLADTVPVHFRAWKTMFESRDIPFDWEAYLNKVDGRTRRDGVRSMMPDAEEAIIIEAADQKQALFVTSLREGLTVFDTSVALVRRLAGAGIRLGVASSSVNIRPILAQAGILDLFGAVVSGADIQNGKPHPEIFLHAAEQLGVTPADSVVFEDAESGVQAAKRGGFHCIGIDRNGRPDLLREADALVNDLGELDASALFDLCGE